MRTRQYGAGWGGQVSNRKDRKEREQKKNHEWTLINTNGVNEQGKQLSTKNAKMRKWGRRRKY